VSCGSTAITPSEQSVRVLPGCVRQGTEQLGCADYLGALQQYGIESPRDPHLPEISLLDYRFSPTDCTLASST
jgi:hypothetical protein